MRFSGFEDWVEIFAGGRQTDSAGVVHDGDGLIERAVNGFSAAIHEPPLVIGHPETDAPAWGWVRELKRGVRNGVNVLLAKFGQVAPEVEGLVKAGRYKKRSAAFYPDGRLRHVGLLGAAPPAVKGLADVAFAGGPAAATFEFESEWRLRGIGRIFGRLRELIIEKFGVEAADRVLAAHEIENLATAGLEDPATAASEEVPMPFTEEQVQAKLDAQKREFDQNLAAATAQARADERKKADAEFAEKARLAAREDRRTTIAAWCEGQAAAGKITPAMVKSGLPAFMEALEAESATLTFGEKASGEGAAAGASGHTPLQWFQKFVEALPPAVTFGELATRAGDVAASDAGAKLGAVTYKLQQEEKLPFAAAFAEAQRRNPDLAAAYAAELAGV
jgi:hypothetical protein